MIIVGLRALSRLVPPLGSTTSPCTVCGHDVWISPETRQLVSGLGAAAEIRCSRCEPPDVDRALLPTQAQIAEIISLRRAERN